MATTSSSAESSAKKEGSSKSPPSKAKAQRPTRAIPTNRVGTTKQFDVLRAFGAVSGPDARSVTNVEVSKIVEMHAATVGLVTPFLSDIGLLAKTNDGLIPSQEVQDYAASYEWNPESAFQRLAPVLRKSWFFQRLLPKLRFGALSREKAITELAMSINAAPSFRGQIETMIEFLEEAGLVADDGNQIRLLQSTESSNGVSDMEDMPSLGPAPSPSVAPSPSPPMHDAGRSQPMATSFANPAAGVVKFNISVNVDMAEFGGWSPDRITAFFAGVAQVLAAKGTMEEKAVNLDRG